MSFSFDRRRFLKLALAGAGLAALPPFLRRARGDGTRRRKLLIVNLPGAIRSSAAFYASPSSRAHNPYGVIEGTGTPFPLGKLLDDHLDEPPLPPEAYRLGPAWAGSVLPRLRDAARALTVLGTWNENRGDHVYSQFEEPTGSPSGDLPGLLTRIDAGLTQSTGASIPAMHLAPSARFGHAPGDFAPYAPVEIADVRGLPDASNVDPRWLRATGGDWARDQAMRLELDDVPGRTGAAAQLLATYRAQHRATLELGATLAAPWLHVDRTDAAHLAAAQGAVQLDRGAGPLTNAMLVELFARGLGPDPSDPARTRPLADPTGDVSWPAALDLALAVRLLQLGCPAVVVNVGYFDLHSDERAQGVPLYRFLGRALAALVWLLPRIASAAGGSLGDETLVATMSDFGRDPGSDRDGYNSGGGTDHSSVPACFYLAHAIFGGGVTPGRLIGGAPLDTFDARQAPVRYGTNDLLATLIAATGLDASKPGFGIDGNVIADVFA